jgi:ATP synthase protein I
MPSKAQYVVLMQLLVTALIALLLMVWEGPTVAASATIGGAIGFVPAWIYTRTMTIKGGAEPQDLLRAQYRAEVYKFAVTAVMFALTFALFRDVSALFLFLTYFITLAVYWVALLKI